jgi:cell division protein FtsB
MIRFKKLFMKALLLLEMIAFGHAYLFGSNGIKVLQAQKNEVTELEYSIGHLNDEVTRLEKEIHIWQTDDFYKEKIAREQLQMARRGDELFYIGT